MSFGQPLWFWAFALFPFVIALYFRNEALRGRMLRQLVAARLVDRLAGNVSVGKRRLRFALLMAGLACVIVSLAQPRWGYDWEQRKHKGRDVLIAIDVSRSMLANDIQPNRLTRAKLAAEDLVGQLPGDRIGVIAFAGTAFLQAPLTADQGAVLASLHELDPEIIPRGGTNIAEAIHTAVDAFGKGESDNRALVIFTDGEELDADGLSAAKELKGSVKIFTVGVGSPEGTIIALPGTAGAEYLKGPDGQIVKSKLDEERLRAIAEATGGFYVHLRNGPPEMKQIAGSGLGLMSEKEVDAQFSKRPIERYQWPLAAGLLLLSLSMAPGERRRSAPRSRAAITASVALLALLSAGSAQAKNIGVEAYEREDYQGALKAFERQTKARPDSHELEFDLGAAAYKSGDMDRALEAFSNALTSPDPQLRAKAEYNLGNTLFQRSVKRKEKPAKVQELRNALQHYEQALKVEPRNANAQYNRDVVRKLIEELEKEPPKQDQQQNKDQQKQDQKNKDQQQKDQQKQDGQQKDQNQQSQGDQKDQQQQQQSGNDQQKDQQQQQSGKQDQQQSGGGKDAQKDPGQEGKDQKDQKGGKDQQDKQDGQGDSQKQQQADKEQQGKDAEKNQQDAQPLPDRKLSGELKNAPQGGNPQQGQQQQSAEEQAAEEAAAAAEGRMTEAQAKNLLDSLKSEDEKVRLLNPSDRQPRGRVIRDW